MDLDAKGVEVLGLNLGQHLLVQRVTARLEHGPRALVPRPLNLLLLVAVAPPIRCTFDSASADQLHHRVLSVDEDEGLVVDRCNPLRLQILRVVLGELLAPLVHVVAEGLLLVHALLHSL